jgi:endothelin-converting enzyme
LDLSSLEGARHSTDENNFNKLKTAYDACLDLDSILMVGADPLVKVLSKIKDTFPVGRTGELYNRSADNKDNFTFKETLVLLQSMEIVSLIHPRADPDDRDPNAIVVFIAPPKTIGLPARELYTSRKILKRYRAIVSKVMSGLLQNSKYLELDFGSIVDFETALATYLPPLEDQEDVTVRKLLPVIELALTIVV